MLESNFQRKLKDDLEKIFPGAMVLKNDPTMCGGIPDLLILYKNKWAALEVKRSEAAAKKSMKENLKQAHKVEVMNSMSYANYVYPENKEDIIHDLEQAFKIERNSRDV